MQETAPKRGAVVLREVGETARRASLFEVTRCRAQNTGATDKLLGGDKAGRKAALTLTIWLMMAGAAIAIAPPYQQAGWLGASMLVLARLIQDFAASGEYGSASAFRAMLARVLYQSRWDIVCFPAFRSVTCNPGDHIHALP